MVGGSHRRDPPATQEAPCDTANETGWTALLGAARGGPYVSPYAAPARATDLSGLPPAFIDVGSAETFRDEDVTYASRIWQAGGVAELHVWPGGFHGFERMAPQAAVSLEAMAAQRSWLRRLLTPERGPFSEIYVAALKALDGQIAAARQPAGGTSPA